MAASVQNQITDMQNATAQYQASLPKTTGTSQFDADTFLMLMLKELQYQDPLSPMDNKEFLAQQAQFTQVSATQELKENMATNNYIMQTLALVGKEVTITDPDNPRQTITGTVTEAGFENGGSCITINGKEYPLSLVQSVREPGTGTNNNTTNDTTTNNNDNNNNGSS